MRIAYLVPEALARGSGVDQKVAAQCRAWQSAGHTVAMFCFVRQRAGDTAPEASRVEAAYEIFEEPWWERSAAGAELQRQAGIARLTRSIRRWAPSLVYLRFGRYALGLRRALDKVPMAVEVNSDDVAEYALGPAALRAWNRATRGLVFRSAAGIVVPTRELAGRDAFARFRRPTVVISNGVDLSRFEPTPPPARARPALVFAASSPAPWHGTDKVLRLARTLPELDFEIIGPASSLAGPSNVTWHGVLAPAAVRARLAEAEIGIGTLALHRKGMEEACPLKVREYLAAGLPTVLAYEDTDFGHGAPFLLRLPNTEDNVETSSEAVARFVHEQRGTRVPRSAISSLDQRIKEAERLAFFERLLHDAR